MGWELRKKHLYYYQKKRQGNKIVSIYVGKNGDELLELSTKIKRLQKQSKLKEQLWRVECKQYLISLQEYKKVLGKDPEYKDRINFWIQITKLMLKPAKQVLKLYSL